jgi:hypothetical protein
VPPNVIRTNQPAGELTAAAISCVPIAFLLTVLPQ